MSRTTSTRWIDVSGLWIYRAVDAQVVRYDSSHTLSETELLESIAAATHRRDKLSETITNMRRLVGLPPEGTNDE